MNILVIPSWYKTEENPVKGSFFEEQARGLQKMGHKVGVFFPEFRPFSSGDSSLYQEYDDDGLPTIRIQVRGPVPRSYRFNYWYLCVKAYRQFKKYAQKYGRPDIIHAHTVFYGGIVADYISQKTGIPYVITEHYTPFITGGITHPYKIKLAQKIFQNTKQAMVVSTSFRQELSEKLNLPPDIFKVVHNMVAPLFFHRNGELFQNDEVTFFTTSFLTERKNHRLMIDAFERYCKKTNKNGVFKIGGDGPIRAELEAYVRQKGLDDKVLFKGLLSRKQVKQELDQSDIFLLASIYETFGVVLIEALAAGKPVITTDSKGPRDIVTNENGIIVDSWKPEDFAGAMEEVTKKYGDYDAGKISRDCFNRFSEDIIIKKLENLYDSITVNN